MMHAAGALDPSRVRSVRYRGLGWPGRARVEYEGPDGEPREGSFTYQESWGKILQRHRQWRCYVCADHTGEFADIAVGDPWYRDIPPDEPGRSLILPRTARGAAFLKRALEAGVLEAERVAPEVLVASQPNLLKTRGSVWGRASAMRVLGLAAPRNRRLATFPAWLRHLSLKERLQAFYGTWKRVVQKRLYRRRPVVPFEPSTALPAAPVEPESLARPSDAVESIGGRR